jgi:hypothetical protein
MVKNEMNTISANGNRINKIERNILKLSHLSEASSSANKGARSPDSAARTVRRCVSAEFALPARSARGATPCEHKRERARKRSSAARKCQLSRRSDTHGALKNGQTHTAQRLRQPANESARALQRRGVQATRTPPTPEAGLLPVTPHDSSVFCHHFDFPLTS